MSLTCPRSRRRRCVTAWRGRGDRPPGRNITGGRSRPSRSGGLRSAGWAGARETPAGRAEAPEYLSRPCGHSYSFRRRSQERAILTTGVGSRSVRPMSSGARGARTAPIVTGLSAAVHRCDQSPRILISTSMLNNEMLIVDGQARWVVDGHPVGRFSAGGVIARDGSNSPQRGRRRRGQHGVRDRFPAPDRPVSEPAAVGRSQDDNARADDPGENLWRNARKLHRL